MRKFSGPYLGAVSPMEALGSRISGSKADSLLAIDAAILICYREPLTSRSQSAGNVPPFAANPPFADTANEGK